MNAPLGDVTSVHAGRSRSGFVADTISFSSVDGPGNRFVVFLQGCNFDCIACHNPVADHVVGVEVDCGQGNDFAAQRQRPRDLADTSLTFKLK